MNWLLDTNVVSEPLRSQPDRRVLEWMAGVDGAATYLSVATIAEIRVGVERLPEGARRSRLTVWLERELPERFSERLLAVDRPVAEAWGKLVARTQRAGSTMEAIDALLAATAEVHDLVLVTRNVDHFVVSGIRTFSPWTETPRG